ncbi:TonB-dependent receptor [Maricurvus nonylphenolicus]|uniref:TonB-dependent receptor n=1 Tax=Maricurvus nonylphenolicus TaxID=1008307 RepID=UPI0036F273A1
MRNRKIAVALSTSLMAAAISSATHAEDNTWAIEEIVVTAQKRAQSSQDVPIALSAFSNDMLKQVGATDFKGLTKMTPGFSVAGGSDAFPRSYIRGIGSNDTGVGVDPSVGVYIDGIYASRNGGALTDLMDVARVEILKGPQGTLFGRNSIGGAISIVTEKPSEELTGEVSVEVGSYNNRVAKGLINIPLIEDTLYMRASGNIQKRDGWQENLLGGADGYDRDRANGRLKFTWLPSDSVEVNFSNSWSRYDETSGYLDNLSFALPFPLNSKTSDINDKKVVSGGLNLFGNTALDVAPLEPRLERSLRDHSVTVDWDITDNLSLASLSSYRTYSTFSSTDYDGTEYYLLNNEGSTEFNETISQEFRLNGSSDNLDWFVGLSATHERNVLDFKLGFADFGPLSADVGNAPINGGLNFSEITHVDTSTDSYAIYGDATWHVTDRLNITFGARYSEDEKDIKWEAPTTQANGASGFSGAGFTLPSLFQFVDANGIPDPSQAQRSDKWSDFSPRIVVDYALAEDAMIYASISKGYKSGGFNSTPNPSLSNFLRVTPEATESVDPEEVINYEVGIKSTWLDSRLLVNASVFALNYDELQVRQINGAVVQLANAGEASNKGLELEVRYQLTQDLTVLANATWMDAEYDEYSVNGEDLSGTPLLFSPDFAGSIALDHSYHIDGYGELRSYISYAYKDDHLYQEGFEQESYGLVDARVSLLTEGEEWEIAVFANNLTDEAYINSYIGQVSSLGVVGVYRNTPKTIGASVSYKF